MDGTAVKPLFWPDPEIAALLGDVQPAAPKRGFGFHRLPVVGSLFDPSYRLHMERVVNAAAAIDRQLAERRPIKIEGDELGVDVTRRLSALIHKSMGWTNDRYVLDDPLEILMLPHNDGFDAHRIKVGIEDYILRRNLPDPVRMMRDHKTLGGLVEWVCDHIAGGKAEAAFSVE